jgi:hypothetical protein
LATDDLRNAWNRFLKGALKRLSQWNRCCPNRSRTLRPHPGQGFMMVEQVATAECNLEGGIIHAVGKKAGLACNQPDVFFSRFAIAACSRTTFRSSVAPKEQATTNTRTHTNKSTSQQVFCPRSWIRAHETIVVIPLSSSHHHLFRGDLRLRRWLVRVTHTNNRRPTRK